MLCVRYCLQQCVHDEKVKICKGAIKRIDHPTAECTAVEHWHAHAVGSLAIRSSDNQGIGIIS